MARKKVKTESPKEDKNIITEKDFIDENGMEKTSDNELHGLDTATEVENPEEMGDYIEPEFNAEVQMLVEEKNHLEEKIAELNAENISLKEDKEYAEQKVVELQVQLSDKEFEIAKSNAIIENLNDEIKNLKNQLNNSDKIPHNIKGQNKNGYVKYGTNGYSSWN